MISAAINSLLRDDVVILPTDTVYGIACNAFSYIARQKIYRIKQRNTKKHLPLMFGSFAQLKNFTDLTEFQEAIIKRFLPGPFTFIVKRKKQHRHFLPEKIAVRIPNCKITLKILNSLRNPIFATSANLSGKKEIKNYLGINQYLKSKIKHVVKSTQRMQGLSSAILDLYDNKLKVVRANHKIMHVLGDKRQ